jgi:SAM-dependent methyltransferase
MPYADYFSLQAPDYARYRPRYPAELFDFLAAVAPRRGRVWDAATGSGQAAVDLAERFEHVDATDISADQLAHAAAHPRVSYARMSAEHAAFTDGSFDLATVATALHWLNMDAYFAEARRVLAADGVVAVWAYFETLISPAVDEVLRHYVDEVLALDWPPQIGHVRDRFGSIPFPFDELPAPELAIEATWTLADLLGYLRTWSPRQRYMARTQADPIDRVVADLAKAWGPAGTEYAVRWPMFLRVGRVASLPTS